MIEAAHQTVVLARLQIDLFDQRPLEWPAGSHAEGDALARATHDLDGVAVGVLHHGVAV